MGSRRRSASQVPEQTRERGVARSSLFTGIALSATVHWLFDRHLISLTDDYGLLVSHNKVPKPLRGLFARQHERVHLPRDRNLWPHLAYVQRHRERFASG